MIAPVPPPHRREDAGAPRPQGRALADRNQTSRPAVAPSSRAAGVTLAALSALAGLAGLIAAGPAAGQAGTEPSALAACLILPSQAADLGSPQAGIIDDVLVERGDAVARGAVLVRMRADLERARASVALTRADSEAELRGAIAAEDLARQRLERSRTLLADRFIAQQAVDQAEAEFRLASEKVAQAREANRVWVGESGVSRAQMAQRVIRAPFAGIITERYAEPGERFEEKPLLRLAAVDELRVEVVAPSRLFGRFRLGQTLDISPDLPGQPARAARVTQIDQVLDPASNTFRLNLALANPGRHLPAGLRCRAHLPAVAADTAGRPAASQ